MSILQCILMILSLTQLLGQLVKLNNPYSQLKTEFIILGTNSRLRDLDGDPASTPYILSVGNVEIKRVKSTKYLGLIADDMLFWSDHVDHISNENQS